MIEVSEKIISYLESLFGEKPAKEYIEFIKREPAVYIRVNPMKTTAERLVSNLKDEYGISAEYIEGIPNALRILSGREMIGKTIGHITGEYYIQGLSSMIPPIVLSPGPSDKVLDLCAAPGSKTTQLGTMMNNGGMLIANEIALDRVKMLVYNIDRMNLINTGVIHNKGEILSKIFDDYFDRILVDAPCSGLGIIQKKGEVSNWWSLEKAERLGDLQLRLLIAAIKMIKTGGEIVYSTCTLTPEENEFIINKVLDKYPVELMEVEIPLKSIPGFTSYGGVNLNPSISKARRIIPWEADTDGFFIAKLTKTGKISPNEKFYVKPSQAKLLRYHDKKVSNLLKGISTHFGIPFEVFSGYSFLIKNNDVFFIVNDWEVENLSVFERIGTRFGIIDRNNQIVLHTQAAQILSPHIKKHIFQITNTGDLKKYLEGGLIKTSGIETAQYAVKYNDSMLGTGIMTNAGLKSRFPRSKRTQEILYF